jgi:hypothetical protein
VDYETYLRENIKQYTTEEASIDGSKILKAKVSSENEGFKPGFVESIAKLMKLNEITSEVEEIDNDIADTKGVVEAREVSVKVIDAKISKEDEEDIPF